MGRAFFSIFAGVCGIFLLSTSVLFAGTGCSELIVCSSQRDVLKDDPHARYEAAPGLLVMQYECFGYHENENYVMQPKSDAAARATEHINVFARTDIPYCKRFGSSCPDKNALAKDYPPTCRPSKRLTPYPKDIFGRLRPFLDCLSDSNCNDPLAPGYGRCMDQVCDYQNICIGRCRWIPINSYSLKRGA